MTKKQTLDQEKRKTRKTNAMMPPVAVAVCLREIWTGRSGWPRRTPRLTGVNTAELRELWASVMAASQAQGAGRECVARASRQSGDRGGVVVFRVGRSAEGRGRNSNSHGEVP